MMPDNKKLQVDREIFLQAINAHESALQTFKSEGYPVIKTIVETIIRCFRQNGKILLAGNGGSAADCQHLAGELLGRYKKDRHPLPAISLAANPSVITCISNDYDSESVFSRQIQTLGNKQDLLWAFSTSGKSPNILKAVMAAKQAGMKIIAFTGTSNTELEKHAHLCLCSHSDHTGHAQEIHQIAYHIICEYIDRFYEENSTTIEE